MPRIDERRQSPSASAGAPNIWHSGAVVKRRLLPITLLLLWAFPLSAQPVNGGRDGAGPVYFTNFGASNDAAANSYIDRYIAYLERLGNGSGGYNNAGDGAGGLVGNFTPVGAPDSNCGNDGSICRDEYDRCLNALSKGDGYLPAIYVRQRQGAGVHGVADRDRPSDCYRLSAS